MSLEKKHKDLQLQTKSTLELYLHGFSLHEIQWEGKSIPQTLNANYFYVASIESLSNVDSPQLRVIQNSTRILTPGGISYPLLTYYLVDYRIFTLGSCLFVLRQVHFSCQGRLTLQAFSFSGNINFLIAIL